MLGKNFNRHFEIFFLFFLENRIWHFMCLSALWPGGCGFHLQPTHTKDFKFLHLALSIKTEKLGIRTDQLSVSMWLGGIYQVSGAWYFRWGSTLKVSIEFPATSRHRRNRTESLLKAMYRPNKTNMHASWMKCQILLSRKNIISLSSAKFTHSTWLSANTICLRSELSGSQVTFPT